MTSHDSPRSARCAHTCNRRHLALWGGGHALSDRSAYAPPCLQIACNHPRTPTKRANTTIRVSNISSTRLRFAADARNLAQQSAVTLPAAPVIASSLHSALKHGTREGPFRPVRSLLRCLVGDPIMAIMTGTPDPDMVCS